jgi:iron(III) transport system permease protein
VVALLYLVARPAVEIFLRSVRIQPRDSARFPGRTAGEWTTLYWERALASPYAPGGFYGPLTNTLVVSTAFTVLAITVGTLLAWLVVRTDMPLKGPIGVLTVLPYILPSWTLAMAWVAMFRNDRQFTGVTGFLQHITGLAVPEWMVYGPVPISLVLAVNYVAFAYLLAAAALATVDSSLEECGEMHGASSRRVLTRITSPLILPALASAFILTFTAGLGTFGVPAYLGSPVGYEMLATWLYGNMNLGRPGDAFVLASVLVILASITFYVNTVVLGRRRQFTTMTGKGSRRRPTTLGRWRWPVSLAVAGSLFAVGTFPIGLLIVQSMQRRLGDYSLSNMTLDYWISPQVESFFQGALADPRIVHAGTNTVVLGVSVGAITLVVGLLMAYIIARGRGTLLSRLLDQLSFLPYIIPGVAFGAIYLTMFARPIGPLPALYGSMALVILASAVYRLPYAVRTGTSAMMQVGPELEEAAKMHGASFLGTIRKVMLPLTKQGLLAGFILVFVGVMKDLSLVIMLVSSRTEVLSVVALGHNERGVEQIAYAIAVIIVAIVLLGVWVSKRMSGADPVTVFEKQ